MLAASRSASMANSVLLQTNSVRASAEIRTRRPILTEGNFLELINRLIVLLRHQVIWLHHQRIAAALNCHCAFMVALPPEDWLAFGLLGDSRSL
jgi:hypothetical protein